jgi:tetratricopeptide (TPR) repeat protein
VAQALRAKRHLLILDNLESITATALAIPHSLTEPQRRELHGFLKALQGGETLVLLGSRGEEAWLAPGTFADNLHPLEGLDPEAASDLADAALARCGARERRQETAFRDLMHLLSGYPLILQVVLPNLAAKPAASVLSELQTGLAAIAVQNRHRSSRCATPGRLGERNTSRPERSERRLRVPIANPSVEVLRRPLEFALYAKELMAEPALAELPLARLGEVLETARGLGLLRRDEHNAVFLRPQPALAWFLTSRLAAPEQAARKAAIERAFRRLYDGYASALSQLQRAKEPEQRKLGFFLVEQEYTNLGTALRLALDQDESILGPYTVLSGHLDVLQDQRRGLELGETVLQALERRPSETMTGKRGADLVRVIDNIATRQLLAKRFEEAKASYEKALSIHDGLGDYTKQLEIGRAGILHRLGMVAQEQRRFEEAAGGYRKALEIKLAFDDRHSAASTYHQLGIVA